MPTTPAPHALGWIDQQRAECRGADAEGPYPEDAQAVREYIAATMREAFPEMDPADLGKVLMVVGGLAKGLVVGIGAHPRFILGALGFAGYDLDQEATDAQS